MKIDCATWNLRNLGDAHHLDQRNSLVSFAPGDADELLDATGVSQGFGVLHVLGDDLMQGAADCRHRVVRHGFACCAVVGAAGAAAAGVTAPRKAVHQIPHRVLPYEVREETVEEKCQEFC